MSEAMILTAMTWSQLVNMDNIFKLTFDLEKSTIDITILNVTIKGFKYSAVKSIGEDPKKIKGIVYYAFIKKRVMWMDFRREEVDFCIKSLKELEQNLLKYKENFESTNKEDDKFLANIIEVWAVQCNIALEEFDTAIENEKLANGDYYAEPLPAKDEIIPIIGKFRANTLNIAKEFIRLIEIESAIRNRGEKLYNQALTELSQYFHVNQKDVKDLSLSFTLIPKER